MTDYRIGLDFGTSQTKVCLLNNASGVREFVKFPNGSYFIPSIITRTSDNRFTYGDEATIGTVFRYFKMAVAEDDDLVKSTFQDVYGKLENDNLDDFKKYSSASDIVPEVLVIQFLTYIYLYVKKIKSSTNSLSISGRLGRLLGTAEKKESHFTINLGIPTEWHNPDHIKRKIKFETLLLIAFEIAKKAETLEAFLKLDEDTIREWIFSINKTLGRELTTNSIHEKKLKMAVILKERGLAVFPESAAGVNYLLKTKRLPKGYYATLDIGAGTSDIALFEVENNQLKRYCCSQSAEIAANDVYRFYAHKTSGVKINEVPFDTIKSIESKVLKGDQLNEDAYQKAIRSTRGDSEYIGLEYILRSSYYSQYYSKLLTMKGTFASNANDRLNGSPIIIFGGGSGIEEFSRGDYCFFAGTSPLGNNDRTFEPQAIRNYIKQVDIVDSENVQEYVHLLTLALGLTYGDYNDDFIPFTFSDDDLIINLDDQSDVETYFYYDIQEAAYK